MPPRVSPELNFKVSDAHRIFVCRPDIRVILGRGAYTGSDLSLKVCSQSGQNQSASN